MKFDLKTLMISMIFLFLFIIPHSLAKSPILYSTIKVTVNEDHTFDLLITRNFDTNYWGTKNWTMEFDSSLKNLRIYDNEGNANILQKNESDGHIDYNFDTNYQRGIDYAPIYISSTGNSLTRINDYFYRADARVGLFGNESLSVNAIMPESMYLFSLNGYGKTDFDYRGRNLSFAYNNSYGSLQLTFIEKNSTGYFSEISYDNKVFFVESDLTSAVNDILNNTDLILNYPLKERSFIMATIGNTSDIVNVSEGGLYLYYNLILVDKDMIHPLSLHYNLRDILLFLHELTHYSNHYPNGIDNYPKWLEEGSAVYSEIKYVEKYGKDSGIAALASDIKPNTAELEDWYLSNKTAESLYTSDDRASYSLYGFFVNHYAKTYGEEALGNALNDIKNQKSSTEKSNFLSDSELENLSISSFIASSGQNISKEDIFFPDKKLLFVNRTVFEDKMRNFTFEETQDSTLIFITILIASGVLMAIVLITSIIRLFIRGISFLKSVVLGRRINTKRNI